MQIFSTGLIVLLVACIGSVFGGVGVCLYFYQDERKKRQIRPLEQPVAKMVELFDTKKLWETTRLARTVALTVGTETGENNGTEIVENGKVHYSEENEVQVGNPGQSSEASIKEVPLASLTPLREVPESEPAPPVDVS